MNNKASHALYSASAEPSPEHEALCAVCRVPPIIWAKTGPTQQHTLAGECAYRGCIMARVCLWICNSECTGPGLCLRSAMLEYVDSLEYAGKSSLQMPNSQYRYTAHIHIGVKSVLILENREKLQRQD